MTSTNFAIMVTHGLWKKRYEVSIQPPVLEHPLRTFSKHPDAVAHAEAIRAVEGWPVRDTTQEKTS